MCTHSEEATETIETIYSSEVQDRWSKAKANWREEDTGKLRPLPGKSTTLEILVFKHLGLKICICFLVHKILTRSQHMCFDLNSNPVKLLFNCLMMWRLNIANLQRFFALLSCSEHLKLHCQFSHESESLITVYENVTMHLCSYDNIPTNAWSIHQIVSMWCSG